MKKFGKTVLVTAGPTREYLDPVRFISNLSSGRLGYDIARCAQKRGYRTILISGPTALVPPKGVTMVSITSARELEQEVVRYFKMADILFMTSAVCDYRPLSVKKEKIKREHHLSITFESTDDILKKISAIKKKQIVCGFCIETHNLRKNALRKLKEKKLDFIIASCYSKGKNPFGDNLMSPLLCDKEGAWRPMRSLTKQKLAEYLLNMVERIKQ
jgi:phosphopantothenoylcysteine decarboxylase / phosphopantothenate---cysteine ligase